GVIGLQPCQPEGARLLAGANHVRRKHDILMDPFQAALLPSCLPSDAFRLRVGIKGRLFDALGVTSRQPPGHRQEGRRMKEENLRPPHTTKPKGVAGIRREAAEAASGAMRGFSALLPKAAAQKTVAPRCRSGWISSSWLTIRRPIPIPTPLPQISCHVVKPIPVRRKIPHGTRVGHPSVREGGVVAI